MQIYRSTVNNPPSPITELYGNVKGNAIASIYILFNDSDPLQIPSSSIDFRGAEIKTSAGDTVGKISSVPTPLNNTIVNIKPFVKITVDPSFDFSDFPDLSSTKIPALKANDPVELVVDGDGNIKGQIVDPSVKSNNFESFAYRVSSFIVRFNRVLLPSLYGSRVILSSSQTTIGMVCAILNNDDGTADAFVFPANLIQ